MNLYTNIIHLRHIEQSFIVSTINKLDKVFFSCSSIFVSTLPLYFFSLTLNSIFFAFSHFVSKILGNIWSYGLISIQISFLSVLLICLLAFIFILSAIILNLFLERTTKLLMKYRYFTSSNSIVFLLLSHFCITNLSL